MCFPIVLVAQVDWPTTVPSHIGAAVLVPLVTSVLAPTPAEAAATCVTDCQGELAGTPCTSFGANPCTATCVCGGTCVSGDCSDGGGA